MDDNDPGELALALYQQRHDDGVVEAEDDVGLSDEVRAINKRLHTELDRVAAHRISPDAPAADFLVQSRNKHIAATRQLYTIAKGETPDDFVEPDSIAPAYAAPKAATGFAVVSAKRRRPAAAPVAADPAPAAPTTSTKPANWLWSGR